MAKGLFATYHPAVCMLFFLAAIGFWEQAMRRESRWSAGLLGLLSDAQARALRMLG